MARERAKSGPKYPDVKVFVLQSDLHVVQVENAAIRALRGAGVPDVEINRLTAQTTSDWDYTMEILQKWVTIVDLRRKLR